MLYKYTTAENGLKLLRGLRMYFTPPKYFNDPFEFRPVRDREPTEDEWRSHLCSRRMKRLYFEAQGGRARLNTTRRQFYEFVDKHYDDVRDKLRLIDQRAQETYIKDFQTLASRTIGAACLTHTSDNETMWAHYGDSHKGVVIGYEIDEDAYSTQELIPVEYTPHRCGVSPLVLWGEATIEDWRRVIATKSHVWSYENEVRWVAYLSDCQPERRDGSIFYYLQLRPADIRQVFLGVRHPESTKRRVCECVRPLHTCELFQYRLDDELFRLVRCRLPKRP